MKEDPAAAQADYLAEFRSDIETFINREIVEELVAMGRYELPPMRRGHGIKHSWILQGAAVRFDDFSHSSPGRSRSGYWTSSGLSILPSTPDHVVREFAEDLRSYRVDSVTGDRFAGLWPAERFEKYGIEYETATGTRATSTGTSSRCSTPAPLFCSTTNMLKEICNLEREQPEGAGTSSTIPPDSTTT